MGITPGLDGTRTCKCKRKCKPILAPGPEPLLLGGTNASRETVIDWSRRRELDGPSMAVSMMPRERRWRPGARRGPANAFVTLHGLVRLERCTPECVPGPDGGDRQSRVRSWEDHTR